MTNINAVKRRVVLSGSAGTGPYAFTFEILDDDDIQVFKDTTLLTKTADYTVTINSNGTGSVTLGVAATSSQSITIIGARDIERTTDFVTAGDLKASSLNEQLDALTIFDQQIDEKVDRSLKGNISDPTNLDYTIPTVDNRKGKYLQFNSTTGAPEAGPNSTDVTTLASVASDIGTLADIQDGTTATNAITTVAGISSNVSTVAGISSNVTTVAGISSNVTAVAGDASDIGTVASNISSVNTNATNITAIQGASANASTATTKASEAAASQTAAASSASSASTSAATATTKAAEAATSAGNASTSETNSAASATAAASSATAAAASQTAAAASAASAATAFDNFDDTYLGAKSSNPTQDNDGNSLVSGALYFNSTANEMRVYDGANWIAATSAGNVSLILYEYTATAGQTTFSGSDDNSATLSYTVDNLQVVMNGIVLDPSDFTATNGTSVVLASGAALNDIVNIYAFKSFTTADMVSKTAGGTFSGAVGFSGGITGDVAFDTNTLKVDSSNNRVGIGSASPVSQLTLGGTSDLVFTQNGYGIAWGGNNGSPRIFGTSGGALTFKHGGGSTAMTIDSSGNTLINCTSARSQNTAVSSGILLQVKGDIVPDVDAGNVGHSDLGDPSYRYEDVYSRDAVTTGSDQNEKQQIASLTTAEMTAAKAISKLFKTFKWNDAVAAKGDAARTHAGVMAQQVATAVFDAGLDAADYAFYMSNTWYEDADGNIVDADTEGATQRTRHGIRYHELLAFIGAATEQRLSDIETRLTALEAAE